MSVSELNGSRLRLKTVKKGYSSNRSREDTGKATYKWFTTDKALQDGVYFRVGGHFNALYTVLVEDGRAFVDGICHETPNWSGAWLGPIVPEQLIALQSEHDRLRRWQSRASAFIRQERDVFAYSDADEFAAPIAWCDEMLATALAR